MRNQDYIAPDEQRLQDELGALVDLETGHIHQGVMTDRIVRAVRKSAASGWQLEDRWSGALLAWFRPVAVIGTLLVLLLAGYNSARHHDSSFDLSTTERVFGFHPVTLASAYDLDLDPVDDH